MVTEARNKREQPGAKPASAASADMASVRNVQALPSRLGRPLVSQGVVDTF